MTPDDLREAIARAIELCYPAGMEMERAWLAAGHALDAIKAAGWEMYNPTKQRKLNSKLLKEFLRTFPPSNSAIRALKGDE